MSIDDTYREPSNGKVDRSVGEEDGFILGRNGVDAIPGICYGCPLCQRGVLPLFGCLVPLAILPSLWQTLIEHVGGFFRLGADDLRLEIRVLVAEVILNLLSPLTVVDNDAGDLVALPGVAIKTLLTRQFPWFGFIDDAVEIASEGQFGQIRTGRRGRGAGTPAVGDVTEPTKGIEQCGRGIAVFEEAGYAHQMSALGTNQRIDLPDLLDEFAPFLARDPGNGMAGKFDDLDEIGGFRWTQWQAGIRMGIKGQTLGEGLDALLIVCLFLLRGKIRKGTTDGQWRVGSAGDNSVGG